MVSRSGLNFALGRASPPKYSSAIPKEPRTFAGDKYMQVLFLL